MSQYTLEELIVRWKQEEMTTEQMIGQILLVLQLVMQRQRELERRVPSGAAAAPGTPRRPA